MSLLQDVVSLLTAEQIRYALIGAAAMAAHGVSRSTGDIDFLTTDLRVLDRTLWKTAGGIALWRQILAGRRA